MLPGLFLYFLLKHLRGHPDRFTFLPGMLFPPQETAVNQALRDQLVRQGFSQTAETLERMPNDLVLLVVVFHTGNSMSGIFERDCGERMLHEARQSSTVKSAELREVSA